MIKPAEWDSTEAFTGDFKSITPGGYICRIKQARVEPSTSGRQMLVVQFDIAEGEFANYYTDQFKKKFVTNPDTKYQGIYRQLTEGSSLTYFKGMIAAIESSNPNYKWNWDESTLKGKLFGGVFGQEEYLNGNNDVKLATKCMYIRSVEQIKAGVKIPEIKRLKLENDFNSFGASFGNEVFPEEEIPFRR
jgi:hypothetical protein